MLDVREAATLSRRTPETIRRWVWSGRLTAVKNGNKLFVRRSYIAADAATDDATMSLREWATHLRREGGASGSSARDLVIEDRAERAGR